MLRIKLLGELGRKYVRELEIQAESMSEVMNALEANFPGFRHYIKDKYYKLFTVEDKDIRDLTDERFSMKLKAGDLVLCPSVVGRGGFGRVLLGSVILVGSIWLGFSPGIAIGASMALGGIVDLLTPKAKKPEEQDRLDSFLSSTSGDNDYYGKVIPLLYGERIIKDPYLLSNSLLTEQLI